MTHSYACLGRPALDVDQQLFNDCRKAGLSITTTCRIVGISRQTYYNKFRSLSFSPEEIDDVELTTIVQKLKEENRKCGARYVKGHLTANAKTAPREKIRQKLREIDPVGTLFRQRLKTGRVNYFSPGPNHVWHIDGNEKLKMFGLYITGCVDGYSRKAFYACCATNKRATTVLYPFKRAVEEHGFPLKVRSDKGLENTKIASFVIRNRGVNTHCFVTGRSVHNQRIERFWGEVNKVTLRYKELLLDLQDCGILDCDIEGHMLAIAYVFIPRIQRSLNQFIDQWNHHPLSSEQNLSPNALYLMGDHADVPLVEEEDVSSSSTSEDSDEDDHVTDSAFQQYARNIVPNPLNDDGSNGRNSFIALLENVPLV